MGDFGASGIRAPLVVPDGTAPKVAGETAESALGEGALLDVAEESTAEIPVYAFTSFDELRKAVDADPPTHDAHGLYNFVQSRLQHPGPLALLAKTDLQKSYDEYVPWFREAGVFGSPMTFDEYAALARKDRIEHAWLKDALMKLEERAFGPIRREPARSIEEVVSAVVSENDAIKEMIAMEQFEAAWHERMGGDATRDLRFIMGVAMAQLTGKHDVHPRALADYLREALRLQEPDAFDKLS